MLTRTVSYPADLRKLYLDGRVFPRWKNRFGRSTLFQEVESDTKQIPVRHLPLKSQRYAFGELFMGVHFLKPGYDVSCDYWGWRWNAPTYRRAVELLGIEVSKLICRGRSHPPDLMVIDKKGRFFFVEVLRHVS